MIHYGQLVSVLAPEICVVVTALAILGADLGLWRNLPMPNRVRRAGWMAFAGCLAALAMVVSQTALVWGEEVHLTSFSRAAIALALIMAAVAAVLSTTAKTGRYAGEYFALLLLSLTGLMLLLSSDNLLVLFIALELAGLPLYALTAFNKSSPRAAEAGLKYFLFGGVAAAFTLFGISLCYGLSGDVRLEPISESLAGHGSLIVWVAMAMILAGFSFKIAAAPFHFWAPDVYEGAPTPVAAFIASVSKIGGFAILARIILEGFGPLRGSAAWGHVVSGWMPLLAVLAICSMVVGNLAALAQTRVKRLLAYSAIAHAGYALLALCGNKPIALASLLFYVFTYGASALGAFGVMALLENSGVEDRLEGLSGLWRRAPLLSGCMLVFMLSLAGVPPLAGFFGKFYVFTAAAGAAPGLGLLWLVILAIAASVLSLYYYLQVLKYIWVADPAVGASALVTPPAGTLAVAGLAALVILLGCLPQLLLSLL